MTSSTEGFSDNTSQPVICPEIFHGKIFGKIHHICTDTAANIVPSLHTGGFDRQLLVSTSVDALKLKSSSGTVSVSIDFSADQRV